MHGCFDSGSALLEDEAGTAVGRRHESAVRLMASLAATLCGWPFCCRFPTNLFDRLPEKASSPYRPAGRWPSCVRVLHGLQPPICFCGVWRLPTEWAQYCALESSEDSPTLRQAGLELEPRHRFVANVLLLSSAHTLICCPLFATTVYIELC